MNQYDSNECAITIHTSEAPGQVNSLTWLSML